MKGAERLRGGGWTVGACETNFNFPIDANARVLQMLPPETP